MAPYRSLLRGVVELDDGYTAPLGRRAEIAIGAEQQVAARRPCRSQVHGIRASQPCTRASWPAAFASGSLDGGPAFTVDTYSPQWGFQTALVERTGLGDGPHTLTITATGARPAPSTGACQDVDALGG